MKKQKSINQNRVWISINYLSLIIGVLLFYAVKILHWPLSYLLFEIGILGVFIVSFFKAFIIPKFWKTVHTSLENLDEREVQVVFNALRYAYSIFAIICLVIIYGFAIAKYQPIDVVIAGSLLYLAHSLPASIIGWNEKNISMEDD